MLFEKFFLFNQLEFEKLRIVGNALAVRVAALGAAARVGAAGLNAGAGI